MPVKPMQFQVSQNLKIVFVCLGECLLIVVLNKHDFINLIWLKLSLKGSVLCLDIFTPKASLM